MTLEELNTRLEKATRDLDSGNYAEVEENVGRVLAYTSDINAFSAADEKHAYMRCEAWARRILGASARRLGNSEDALWHLDAALTLSTSIDDTLAVAKALRGFGTVHMHLSNYEEALKYLYSALESVEKLGEENDVAAILIDIGFVHTERADLTTALEYLHKARVLCEERGFKHVLAAALGVIGTVYRYQSNYAEALRYHNKALVLLEEFGNTSSVATVCGNIGTVYLKLSDYPKALEYFTKALASDEAQGYKEGMARHLTNIGIIHVKLSEFPKALEYYGRALKLDEEIGHKSGVAILTGNIGGVYSHLSDVSTALEYYKRALLLDEELGNDAGVARHLTNIGQSLEEMQDFEGALEQYDKAMQIDVRSSLLDQEANTRACIGKIYANSSWLGHDDALAEEYLLESNAQYEALGTREYFVLKELAELYERQERWKESQQYLKKFHALRDEVQSDDAKKSIAMMEQRQQIEANDRERAVSKAAAAAELHATRGVLDSVLPTSIATRMIAGEKRIADYFPNVSILFADIVGFTSIATEVPPDVVVDFLNHVFDIYDEIIKRHGCEKIKTIGDGYMAISGAPLSCEDHAERIARAAIEMQNDILLPSEIRDFLPRKAVFNIRIGIHTGAAVCGVIGKERFVWDAYSDAVNTASRMESSGEPGKIHVSRDFAWLLRSRQKMTNSVEEFQMVERGDIEIKGKGMMRTYFLEKA